MKKFFGVDTCFINLKNYYDKCKAFTLAEVLITLGIIGIVAAITIPNLITTHQKKVTVTKLQKAISVINQAYRLSFNEVGDPDFKADVATTKTEDYFNRYWAPYIKSAHICKSSKDCGYKSNNPFYRLSGGSIYNDKSLVNSNGVTFYVPDGTLYRIYSYGVGKDGPLQSLHIIIDLNGGKGPNKFGKDVFYFERALQGGGINPYGYEKSNITINYNCSKSSNGYTCAEKIRRAGWQIDKSYPW